MARDYVCLRHKYLVDLSALGDAEKGRLFTAMMEYDMTGSTQQLSGNEKLFWPMVKRDIDDDKAVDNQKREKTRASASKRWSNANDANACERIQTHERGCERMTEDANGCDTMRNDASSARARDTYLSIYYTDKDKNKNDKVKNDNNRLIDRSIDNNVNPVSSLEMVKHKDNLNAIGEACKRIGMPFEACDFDKAEKLLSEYEIGDILKAFDVAAESGQASKRNWRYIGGILKSAKKEGWGNGKRNHSGAGSTGWGACSEPEKYTDGLV